MPSPAAVQLCKWRLLWKLLSQPHLETADFHAFKREEYWLQLATARQLQIA